MKKFMKVCISLLLMASMSVHSAAILNYLDVKQGVVVFSFDEAKASTPPACVDTNNANYWALSLDTENGRAIYTLLMTAMASNIPLGIESAGDCDDAPNYERPHKVWFEGTTESSSEQTFETVALLKTVGYGHQYRTGSHGSDRCSVYKTLKNGQNEDYLYSVTLGSGARNCTCAESATLVTTSYTPSGSNNGHYRKDIQCVIEVNTPVIP
ncbi:hypothetical protein [Paraglaciecola sp.]|uniref:hypothetical protein n=1 Tax=Paraglaciecola sp. TaxID=1920173 RepID=UPI003EF967D4